MKKIPYLLLSYLLCCIIVYLIRPRFTIFTMAEVYGGTLALINLFQVFVFVFHLIFRREVYWFRHPAMIGVVAFFFLMYLGGSEDL